jgi:glycosyltransferase involved in cell wall biosynthesis
MHKAPVSAVMAVRNGARFIGEALQSVRDQSMPPQEIIVIDDGSSDDTAAQVQRIPGVSYVRQEPQGGPSARNHGVRLASMPYLAFLDADDLWHPEKTECQFGILSTDTTLDYVTGQMIQFTGDARDVLARGLPSAPGRLLGMMMIRRDSFRRVGPFAAQLQVGEMLEWWDRAVAAGLRGEATDAVALLRRIHDDNLGRHADPGRKDYLRVLHALVLRRRQQP